MTRAAWAYGLSTTTESGAVLDTWFPDPQLGTAGVLVFAANLDHLTGSPQLYGSSWNFLSQDVTSNTSCGAPGVWRPITRCSF